MVAKAAFPKALEGVVTRELVSRGGAQRHRKWEQRDADPQGLHHLDLKASSLETF